MAKNPNECCVIHSTSTLILQDELTLYEAGDDEVSPMEIYHPKLARFVMTIISKQRKSAYCNINVAAVPGVIGRTKYAREKYLNASLDAAAAPAPETGNEGPAYTVTFTSGTYKGKTPAEALLSGATEEEMGKQFQWLKSKLSQYPGNQKQMDAINQAVSLYRKGKLEAKARTVVPEIEIYNSGMRPILRKKREDGKAFVYEGKVTCIPTDRYPIQVEINNYYAPVAQQDSGMIHVLSGKSDEEKITMRLTMDQWDYAVYTMKAHMRNFEMLHAKACSRAAEQASYRSQNPD